MERDCVGMHPDEVYSGSVSMTPQDITRLTISVIIIFGFGGVLVAWMIFPPGNGVNSNLLSGLTGALASGYVQVISYYFQKSST